MSMEEIRAGFLNYYEKRIKLSLFKSEIEQVKGNASSIANANPTGSGSQYSLVTFNLEVINLVLADTYTLLAQLPDLVRQLSDIRMTAWIVNTKIEIFFAQVSQPLTGIADIVKRHNEQVAPNCSQIVDSCNLALASLNAIIELK